MFLNKLTLINFKNYREATLSFPSAVNCFIGNNGSGKTNLLDAIHYLSMTKSYFSSSDTQNILHGEHMLMIQGEFNVNGTIESVMCGIRQGTKKQFTRNSEEYERLSDHIGAFPVVMIAPTDQDLITEGSDVRRRFIDTIISQYDHVYLDNLIRYNQVLLQRNSLLKNVSVKGFVNWNDFAVWDDQLIHFGTLIHRQRHEFLEGFKPFFDRMFRHISGGSEEAGIIYESRLNEAEFGQLLLENRSRDYDFQYTTTGIHKDDLSFLLDNFPVRKYASQGQQKSFVIAMKLAQFSYQCQQGLSKPLVLLDDIFDKLDENRVAHLMELVSADSFGQIFITDTHHNRVPDILNRLSIPYTLFQVEQGRATPSEIPVDL